MIFRLDGQVALITGGGDGIGRAAARLMAAQGARIAVCGLQEHKLKNLAAEMEARSNDFFAMACDVTDVGQVRDFVRCTVDRFGRIDILVNNAGGRAGQPRVGADNIEDVTEENWEKVVRLNLTAPFFLCREVVPIMRRQQYGRIVNISSGAGRHALNHTRGTARLQYASAKTGLVGFTRQLAKELAPHGINVNCVAPGLIDASERLQRGWMSITEEERQHDLAHIPLGRRGTAEEVAAAILFLASREASFMVGHTLDVNGGRWMD